ncbi:MAG TPA: hypothetical protein VMU84_11885 [Thermoanaerobaculia bacterium]|nr:hypothetical protein [Thermoanaerobaculia bacterium]
MPKQKDLKRVIRTRMQKTGESYTTARLHVLPKNEKSVDVPKVDYAALAGMSDETVKKATGCDWAAWVRALDAFNSAEKSHREIAQWVFDKYKISGWWSQSVTVGYERIKGLRERGQRRGGGYEISKSKTVAVPLSKLYRAFRNARTRAKWIAEKFEVRTATVDRSMRILWSDGTAVDVGFFAKGDAKSQVAIQHSNLKSKEDAAKMKAYWGERLNALAAAVM